MVVGGGSGAGDALNAKCKETYFNFRRIFKRKRKTIHKYIINNKYIVELRI